MRSNKGLGRNYARKMRMEEEKELAAQVKVPTPKALAKARHTKQLGARFVAWFLKQQVTEARNKAAAEKAEAERIANGEEALVQVTSGDIDVTRIGVKRKSISNAQRRLTTLQSRGARPRSIKRAKARLELRKTAEQDRKSHSN